MVKILNTYLFSYNKITNNPYLKKKKKKSIIIYKMKKKKKHHINSLHYKELYRVILSYKF